MNEHTARDTTTSGEGDGDGKSSAPPFPTAFDDANIHNVGASRRYVGNNLDGPFAPLRDMNQQARVPAGHTVPPGTAIFRDLGPSKIGRYLPIPEHKAGRAEVFDHTSGEWKDRFVKPVRPNAFIHGKVELRPRPHERPTWGMDDGEWRGKDNLRNPNQAVSDSSGMRFKKLLCGHHYCKREYRIRIPDSEKQELLAHLVKFGHQYPAAWFLREPTEIVETEYLGIMPEELVDLNFPNDGHQYENDDNQFEKASLFGQYDVKRGFFSQMMCPNGRPKIIHTIEKAKDTTCDRFYVTPGSTITVRCTTHGKEFNIFLCQFIARGKEWVEIVPPKAEQSPEDAITWAELEWADCVNL